MILKIKQVLIPSSDFITKKKKHLRSPPQAHPEFTFVVYNPNKWVILLMKVDAFHNLPLSPQNKTDEQIIKNTQTFKNHKVN